MTQIIVSPALVEDLLAREGRASLKMYGCSMAPLLAAGKKASVQTIGREKIKIGDIVCFRLGSHLSAHRVVGIEGSPEGGVLYLPKGDNASQFDPLLPREKIIGKVVAIEDRPITSLFWRLAGWAIAEISCLEGKAVGWRTQSKVYRLLYRLKTRLGIERSFHPRLCRFLRYCLDAARARLDSLCLKRSK